MASGSSSRSAPGRRAAHATTRVVVPAVHPDAFIARHRGRRPRPTLASRLRTATGVERPGACPPCLLLLGPRGRSVPRLLGHFRVRALASDLLDSRTYLVMSEESRLGRESIETGWTLKKIIDAGVRVFYYLEDRER